MSKTAVKQKRGTSLFYTINRILIGITLIASVIGMFFVNDDSQRSRFAFVMVQSLLFLLCSFVPNFLEKKSKSKFFKYITCHLFSRLHLPFCFG